MSDKIDKGKILYKEKLKIKKDDSRKIIKIYSLLFKKSFKPLLNILFKIQKNKNLQKNLIIKIKNILENLHLMNFY